MYGSLSEAVAKMQRNSVQSFFSIIGVSVTDRHARGGVSKQKPDRGARKFCLSLWGISSSGWPLFFFHLKVTFSASLLVLKQKVVIVQSITESLVF